jgi:hypothetical protein
VVKADRAANKADSKVARADSKAERPETANPFTLYFW